MPALIPFTFGNRRVDIFGNVHNRYDDRLRVVLRDPGRYRGRHRRVGPPNRWQVFLAWVWDERV